MRRATGSARGKGYTVMTTEAIRMRDGPPVTDLVTRAIAGDSQAWDALVERYIPLVWSICRGHRIDHTDARTVGQAVWRQLAGELHTLRNPPALAGWLATTTHRECDRIRRAAHSQPGPGQTANTPGGQAQTPERELLAAELHAALREAFAQLPPRDRHAHPGPAGTRRRDQRHAGHPSPGHQPQLPPLPATAAPLPGHRHADPRPNQRRPVAGEVCPRHGRERANSPESARGTAAVRDSSDRQRGSIM